MTSGTETIVDTRDKTSLKRHEDESRLQPVKKAKDRISSGKVTEADHKTGDSKSFFQKLFGLSNKSWSDLQLGFTASLLASFFAALISIVVGYLMATSNRYWFKRKFGRFFGGYRAPKAYSFVIDCYKEKGHPTTNMGSCNAYILTYLSPVFEKYLGEYPHVVLDKDFKDWERTLILLGSPFTNSVVDRISQHKQYIEFTGWTDNAKEIKIVTPDYKGPLLDLKNGNNFGIVLKLKNPYSPGHFLLFLAGLTNESTSAAGLLLRKSWTRIFDQIGDEEFLIAFKVDLPGEDQTYKVIYTYPDMSL